MSAGLDDVIRDVEEDSTSAADRLVSALADRLGASATARAVFGEPVDRDGITVIPVAKVRYGFGGGGGRGGETSEGGSEGGEGSGGGGGATASPLGYIEVTGGEARFVRIKDPAALIPLVAVGAVAFWIVMRALRGLFR
ncbi:MAG: hypothetical protein IT303_08145 [Dehalococcoidia bacterium]|nr:hypothetical protein [Dehalococcoidia bacterium]